MYFISHHFHLQMHLPFPWSSLNEQNDFCTPGADTAKQNFK